MKLYLALGPNNRIEQVIGFKTQKKSAYVFDRLPSRKLIHNSNFYPWMVEKIIEWDLKHILKVLRKDNFETISLFRYSHRMGTRNRPHADEEIYTWQEYNLNQFALFCQFLEFKNNIRPHAEGIERLMKKDLDMY